MIVELVAQDVVELNHNKPNKFVIKSWLLE
jgi:hypothetical protein